MSNEPTLFDLNDLEGIDRKNGKFPQSWIVYYVENGTEYWMRKTKRKSYYDPIAKSFDPNKDGYAPRRFKTKGGALRWAQELTKTTRDGRTHMIQFKVKEWE